MKLRKLFKLNLGQRADRLTRRRLRDLARGRWDPPKRRKGKR